MLTSSIKSSGLTEVNKLSNLLLITKYLYHWSYKQAKLYWAFISQQWIFKFQVVSENFSKYLHVLFQQMKITVATIIYSLLSILWSMTNINVRHVVAETNAYEGHRLGYIPVLQIKSITTDLPKNHDNCLRGHKIMKWSEKINLYIWWQVWLTFFLSFFPELR